MSSAAIGQENFVICKYLNIIFVSCEKHSIALSEVLKMKHCDILINNLKKY